jgi:hypothetical protein
MAPWIDSAAARTKLLQGPSGKGQARKPNLSPGIFSAHDHAEGEFFSAANENAGHSSETAQVRQTRQAFADGGSPQRVDSGAALKTGLRH